jgi:predicted amidohydrolase
VLRRRRQPGRRARAGHRSGGRSMIVDPWGVVLAQAPDSETFDPPSSTSSARRDPPHAARRSPTAPAAYRWPTRSRASGRRKPPSTSAG